MKIILMLDALDAAHMREGAMIQIPGQVETYIAAEPKRAYSARRNAGRPSLPKALPAPAAKGSTDPRGTCQFCGASCQTRARRASHERQCQHNPRRGMKR